MLKYLNEKDPEYKLCEKFCDSLRCCISIITYEI